MIIRKTFQKSSHVYLKIFYRTDVLLHRIKKLCWLVYTQFLLFCNIKLTGSISMRRFCLLTIYTSTRFKCMQQIRGLIPSENNAYASSRTIKNLVSFLFSFVCYDFIQRTRKIVFIFCLLERYKKNIKCKMIIGVYAMLSNFVPLKALLSIHYHRCFTYN